MAWTNPRTWVTSETVTAALMNTHVRDNLKAIGDAWTSYGSGASWTASSVNPSLGNGTWSGAYSQAGKLVNFRIGITMGSTTTYGTGTWQLALPVTPTSHTWSFTGVAVDTSAVNTFPVVFARSGATINGRVWPGSAGGAFGALNATAPFTWANTDLLFLSGTYEAA